MIRKLSAAAVLAAALSIGALPAATPAAAATTAALEAQWAPDTAYNAGDLIIYSSRTYECRQTHLSTSGSTPDTASTLWQPVE
ncbi:carbohydrate-binding protein [Streptosporangium carneum]|uniref:Chitin-binding type-3 domain-containing protein n=1 Tax=Streptosporangium carneum TaxID=47481 RepID=A0A9W6I0G4_9ACTN|nr:carbohydrate-binding protein [Streptosporangium carneum]GLK09691.1 hypothetical protein GCM10017600_30970 [Streptosporangium carneum]